MAYIVIPSFFKWLAAVRVSLADPICPKNKHKKIKLFYPKTRSIIETEPTHLAWLALFKCLNLKLMFFGKYWINLP